MKKYDNREEMKRILLAGNLNSNNDDSWNVRRILDGATPDFAFHGYKIHSGASKLCLCNEGGKYVCKWVTDDRYYNLDSILSQLVLELADRLEAERG